MLPKESWKYLELQVFNIVNYFKTNMAAYYVFCRHYRFPIIVCVNTIIVIIICVCITPYLEVFVAMRFSVILAHISRLNKKI